MMKAKIINRVSSLEGRDSDLEFEQKVEEVEKWYEERKSIFNSPEQVELRRKNYEKLIAEGNLRKEHVYNHDCKQ